jgi:hypothetical protein
MKCVYAAPDLARAQLVSDLLAQHGIENHVLNTHASTLSGEIPVFHSGPRVWVANDADMTAARTLIEESEQSSTSDATQHCPSCGEECPASFELCWQCGAELGATSAG